MKTILFTIISFIFLLRIHAQSDAAVSDSNMVICYFPLPAFDVQYNNVKISLPDSLSHTNIDKLLVKIFINKTARIDSFTVIKVLIGQDKKRSIMSLKHRSVDEETRRYYPFIREFLTKKLQIKKLSEPTEQYTQMILPIKIAYPPAHKKPLHSKQ
jgi:uridine kinase